MESQLYKEHWDLLSYFRGMHLFFSHFFIIYCSLQLRLNVTLYIIYCFELYNIFEKVHLHKISVLIAHTHT